MYACKQMKVVQQPCKSENIAKVGKIKIKMKGYCNMRHSAVIRY